MGHPLHAALFGSGRIDYLSDLGYFVCRKATLLGMLANHGFIGRDIYTIDLVVGHVTFRVEVRAAFARLFSNALLARSPSRLRPEFRITSGIQDGKDYNALRFDTEEDGVWEFRNEGAPHLAVYTRKYFWIALNCVERGIHGGKKLFAKAFALSFVIPEPTSEIPSNLPTVDNWQGH